MIHEILPINNYQGNGSSTIFDFDFYIENESQLNVFFFEKDGTKTKLELNVDYSVNELKNENGSYITFPLPSSKHGILQSEQKLFLELTLPISQETQYNNSSLLNLKALEYSLDYLTRLIQILAQKITRCVKIEECSLNNADSLLESINKAQINTANKAQDAKEEALKAAEQLELVKKQVEIIFQKKLEIEELVKTQFSFKKMLTNTILEAPNGVFLVQDAGIIVKEGLRVLIPDGFNEDGTLKNIDYVLLADVLSAETSPTDTNKCFITIDNKGGIHTYINYFAQEQNPKTLYTLWYKPSENRMYRIYDETETFEAVNETLIGKYLFTNGEISELYPFNPVQLLTDSTLKQIPHIVEQYQNERSYYRIYSDGRCTQGGYIGFNAQGNYTAKISFLKPYKDAYYSILTSASVSAAGETGANAIIIDRDESSITLKNNNNWQSIYWQADGYIN